MSDTDRPVRAALVAIGDEILSGRTREGNAQTLARWLGARGGDLCEVRIIGDDAVLIGETVRTLMPLYTHIFTCGGIGPTHDDITFAAIAQALGQPMIVNTQAMARLEAWYSAQNQPITPERARMAEMPEGVRLIENSASGAPGVVLDNLYIMAGVPRIFSAMLESLDQEIPRAAIRHSRAITAPGLPESRIAGALNRLQTEYPDIAVGSYPIDGDEKGVTVVLRGMESEALDQLAEIVANEMRLLGIEPAFRDHTEA